MGCGSSKSGLNAVDDSVHVMLQHDKKVQLSKGQPEHKYKARAEHPLLLRPKSAIIEGTEPEEDVGGGGRDGGGDITSATDDGGTNQ